MKGTTYASLGEFKFYNGFHDVMANRGYFIVWLIVEFKAFRAVFC